MGDGFDYGWLKGMFTDEAGKKLLQRLGACMTEYGAISARGHSLYEFVPYNDGCTCLLFPFSEDIKLDMGKLAMWRLATHDAFGGTWLSDYVPNRLGGFMDREKDAVTKPDCPLIGQDGNIFNLMGIAARTLKKNGMAEQAREMRARICDSGSYDKALCIIGEYVNITSVEDENTEEGMECGL